jgi:hypothetical protein
MIAIQWKGNLVQSPLKFRKRGSRLVQLGFALALMAAIVPSVPASASATTGVKSGHHSKVKSDRQ